MKNEEKHKVTGYYLSIENIDWLEKEAARAMRSNSNMLDILITQLRNTKQKPNAR